MGNKTYTLAQLAGIAGGRVEGDGGVKIAGVARLDEAGPGDVTLYVDTRYESLLGASRASAVVRAERFACALPSIVSDNPQASFARILALFAVFTDAEIAEGVHASSFVEPSAVLGPGVRIGPFCRVGRNARIGAGTRLLFGVYVGDRVVVGEECLVYPNVTIREASEIGDRVVLHPGVVIGADGFGFVWDGERHLKIPQIGRVVIEDDVEIGANSAVDRATMGATRIGRGSKIDNLVQIGHNNVIGRHTLLAGQVGVGGSTEIGDHVTAGGQAGFAGHMKIGDGAVIASQAGVTKDIPAGMTVSGYPAREHRLARKLWAFTNRLPELFERLKAAESKLAALEKDKANGEATEDDR